MKAINKGTNKLITGIVFGVIVFWFLLSQWSTSCRLYSRI